MSSAQVQGPLDATVHRHRYLAVGSRVGPGPRHDLGRILAVRIFQKPFLFSLDPVSAFEAEKKEKGRLPGFEPVKARYTNTF